jgi:hypothetical protein
MRRKTGSPLDTLSVAASLLFLRVELDPLVRRLGVDHPDVQKAVEAFFEHWKRQYDRKIRAQALRERRRWRKADIPALVELFLLPGCASPASQRCIARLMLAEGKAVLGRGAIPPPQKFEDAFFDALKVGRRIADPATSPNERRALHKKLPKYPDLIEAAFRGEIARAKIEQARFRLRTDRTLPYRIASELAEERVAEAAGLSPAVVHQLCQQVRDATKREKERGERERKRGKRGFTVTDEPMMTAAQLKAHLEWCPTELAQLPKAPDSK